MAKRICSVDDCGRMCWRREWCSSHYHRWQRHGDPLGGSTYHGDGPITLAWVLTIETDDCVIWPLGVNSAGYGTVWLTGLQMGAHAVVCERAHGPRPTPDHEAAHSCGVRDCVNYRHLRWAMPVENSADKAIHGTHLIGERNHASVLTVNDVLDIRSRPPTETRAAIAREYGVSRHCISAVISRQTWAWLDAPEI